MNYELRIKNYLTRVGTTDSLVTAPIEPALCSMGTVPVAPNGALLVYSFTCLLVYL